MELTLVSRKLKKKLYCIILKEIVRDIRVIEWVASEEEVATCRGRSKSSNNRNPVGNDGDVLRCYVCDSTKHLSPSCPYKQERDSNTVEEIHIVLLGSTPNEKQKQFVVEALGKGVLDSGCTKTVAGKDWMSEFIDTLSIKDKNYVSEKRYNSSFRFGDGIKCEGLNEVTIPVIIGGKRWMLAVSVVENAIPLLISNLKGYEKNENAAELH